MWSLFDIDELAILLQLATFTAISLCMLLSREIIAMQTHCPFYELFYQRKLVFPGHFRRTINIYIRIVLFKCNLLVTQLAIYKRDCQLP